MQMSTGTDSRIGLSGEELVIQRVFDAPRDVVFKAWTEPARLMRWWGPKGFTTPSFTVDLRIGGALHYCMRSPEGRDYWGIGVFLELDPPRRFVYTDAFADAEGNKFTPSDYGMSASHPLVSLVTVTFSAQQEKTSVTLRQSVPDAVEEREGMAQGWSEMLERLAGLLAVPERQ
jgi:uncharacterized protein YndB with AHSA1/START domain